MPAPRPVTIPGISTVLDGAIATIAPVTRSRKVLVAAAAVIVALAAYALLRPARNTTTPAYATAKASVADIEQTVLATAKLEPKALVSVGAQVSGQIKTLAVAVTHPTAGNIGGGGFLVVRLPDGTATTFDVVDRDNVYRGGAIAAGVATSLKSLATNAAQLFNVELYVPEQVIGRNTADQLRSGIVTGHLAMLEGMITRIDEELGERASVILTGGLSTLFAGRSPRFDVVDPDLTLAGLYLIHQRLQHAPGAS